MNWIHSELRSLLVEPGAVGSSFWKNMKTAAKTSSLGNNSPYVEMTNNMSEALKQNGYKLSTSVSSRKGYFTSSYFL